MTGYCELYQREYGPDWQRLRWLDGASAQEFNSRREQLLASLEQVNWAYGHTKPFSHTLSPGCQLCGSGDWSCLFINGFCNAGCFFCPAPQHKKGIAGTNNLNFERPADYVDYLERFGFRGVSFSGGEPLQTLDRTLTFLRSIRKHFGQNLYIWLYTSGAGLTSAVLAQLQKLGLNEIRFNICSSHYHLEKVKTALPFIEHVTIEIPAIPEDWSLLTNMLEQAAQIGVSYINLHQLRITPHNLHHMLEHDYTALPGQHITVLESELTALKLLDHARISGLKLPINYCSYVYKNRYQSAAARRRAARFICAPYEEITQNGYIRRLSVCGEPDLIEKSVQKLANQVNRDQSWSLNKTGDRLTFTSHLWSELSESSDLHLEVSYMAATIRPSVSYQNYFKQVHLNPKRDVFVERLSAMTETRLQSSVRDWFQNAFILGNRAIQNPKGLQSISPHSDCPDKTLCRQIREFELIPDELQPYRSLEMPTPSQTG
ncbi:radical SAM protein [bacterium]|nr:radical SAM protein [bacterium]